MKNKIVISQNRNSCEVLVNGVKAFSGGRVEAKKFAMAERVRTGFAVFNIKKSGSMIMVANGLMRPATGQSITVRNTLCKIVAILPLGTIEVQSICGHFNWRISGLPF